MISSSFLDEISAMISERRAEVQEAEAEAQGILRRIDFLQGEVRVLEAAGQMYRAKHDITETIRSKELEGKTQMAALLLIAKRDSGLLRVKDAKRLMLEAGLIRTPKNAASIIYTLIKRSELFDKVGVGRYRLREPSNIRAMKMA